MVGEAARQPELDYRLLLSVAARKCRKIVIRLQRSTNRLALPTFDPSLFLDKVAKHVRKGAALAGINPNDAVVSSQTGESAAHSLGSKILNQLPTTLSEHAEALHSNIANLKQTVATHTKPARSRPKGMKVEMDMITPTVVAGKHAIQDWWDSLPEPVQQVCPHLGTAALVGVVTHCMHARQMEQQLQRRRNLEAQNRILLARQRETERELMEAKIQLSQSKSSIDVSLAHALAQVTSAAAAAATAASEAASAASMKPRGGRAKK